MLFSSTPEGERVRCGLPARPMGPLFRTQLFECSFGLQDVLMKKIDAAEWEGRVLLEL